MAAIGWIVVVLGAMTALTLLRGVVFVVLWHWFIVPLFPVPYLNVGEAIGIALVVGFLLYSGQQQQSDRKKRPAEVFVEKVTEGAIYYIVVLLLAAIVHIWVP